MSASPSLFEKLESSRLTAPSDQARRLKPIGGNYIPDFIAETEEKALLNEIGNERWSESLQRRVQHYGYRYDYNARTVNEQSRLGKLPQWADSVIEKLMAQSIFKDEPDQMIVNEYRPGQGIAPHTDRDCFGPIVASLSLGGACLMELIPPENDRWDRFNVVLEPCSLVVFSGATRNEWKHGIAKRKQDKDDDSRSYDRELRISLTFRTVINEG